MIISTIERHIADSDARIESTFAGSSGSDARPRSGPRQAQGLDMKEIAVMIGVTPNHLSQIAVGGKRWTAATREKGEPVLGEVLARGFVERRRDVVEGGSSRIRERARVMGMGRQDHAERAGVSYGYMVQASRGHRTMGPKVRARAEPALQAPRKWPRHRYLTWIGTRSSGVRTRTGSARTRQRVGRVSTLATSRRS